MRISGLVREMVLDQLVDEWLAAFPREDDESVWGEYGFRDDGKIVVEILEELEEEEVLIGLAVLNGDLTGELYACPTSL